MRLTAVCASLLALVLCSSCKHNTPDQIVDDTTTTTPYISPVAPPATAPDQPPPVATTADDDAIISAVIANGESEDSTESKTTTATIATTRHDRAVCFGNNFPGTEAQLGQCVNDAKKCVLNLVKVDHFNTKDIRLITDQKCTAANYKKWVVWAIANTQPGDRRFISNSSHGSQDTTPDGKVIGIICTWDMISTNDWSPEHEISFQWWYDTLRTTNGAFTLLLDQCYAGGSVKLSLAPTGKKFRSLAPSAAAQARIDNAVEHSNAQTRLAELTGFVNPACAANELSSEDSVHGGEGTEAYWQARRALTATPLTTDIVRQENGFLRSIQATQHMQLVGLKGNLWGVKP